MERDKDRRYNELFATYCRIIYDRIRDRQAEVDFLDWAFRSLAHREVNLVLDIACGTGRLAIPLRRLGYDVIGVDFSSAMLSCCLQEGGDLPVVRGDMRYLPFKSGTFDAMFCMFSSLNHLNENDEIVAALKGFHRSLRPGGILILDLISPFKFFRVGFQSEEVHRGKGDGISVERRLKYRIDEVNAIWVQTEHATIKIGSETLENREVHHIRLLTYPEIRYLLEGTGFEDVRCFGNFRDREIAADKADRLITVALKPREG